MSDDNKIDPVIKTAIQEAVIEFGQDKRLANRIIAWFSAISNKDLPTEEINAHLENVLEVIEVNEKDADEV